MKYINKEMNLDKDDFDFGDFDNKFKITEQGWAKIFKYYGLEYTTNKEEAFNRLKPHLKQITGSRLYVFSGSSEVGNFTINNFTDSSLLTILKILGVIKESGSSIYTDTGVYYENAIRSYVGNKNDVLTWNTFSLKDEPEKLNKVLVNNEEITPDNPIRTVTPTGNIFNLPNAIINFDGHAYHIDLSIFGGMPDGYPVFAQNNLDKKNFDLIEVKTKSFSKFESEVSIDELGSYDYNAVVAPMVRVYEFVYDDNKKLINATFIKQRPVTEEIEQENSANNFTSTVYKNGYKTQRVEISGMFPVLKLENNQPIFSQSKYNKQFKTNANNETVFAINDPSYYCQASLYALLTWLNKQIPRFENGVAVYDVSINDLENLKVLFAMGIIKPDHYLKFSDEGGVQIYTVNDGKTTKTITNKELEQLLKVDELYTELYKVSSLELVNVNSKYASNHHSKDNRLNLITLLAECSDRYLSFFKEQEDYALKDVKDKATANALKKYFLTRQQENENNASIKNPLYNKKLK